MSTIFLNLTKIKIRGLKRGELRVSIYGCPLFSLALLVESGFLEISSDVLVMTIFWLTWLIGGIVFWKIAPRLMIRFSNTTASIKSKASSRLEESSSSYRSALAMAEKEIEEGKQDPGTWAQALIKANGDETKRKVCYMSLRAKQIVKINHL